MNEKQLKKIILEEIQNILKEEDQTQVVSTKLTGVKITSVKKEGEFIVVTVASDQYPNVVGTGKAKFRGDMDFARDSAAAQARKDLALKIQGQK